MTEELLERLLTSATPEAYLDVTPTVDIEISDYLNQLLAKKGLKRADVIREAGLNATFGYQLFYGTRHPGRDTAIMLAFGLNCSLLEAQRLLKLAGCSELWCKRRRDAIIIFCINHGYSRQETDEELYRFGEETLLSGD